MSTTLRVEARASKKRSDLKEMRKNHKIPGILYGNNVQKKVSVDETDLLHTLRQHSNELITVDADGEKYQVLIAEVQKQPIKDQILHVDFRQVDMNKKVLVEVPITLTGESKGVAAGGVIQQQTQAVSLRCLPNEIPSAFTVDITDLDIGDLVKLQDVMDVNQYDLESDPNETILTIRPPRMNVVDEETKADNNLDGGGEEKVFVEETE